MGIIYHITTQEKWDEAQQQGEYTHASLEEEGFIHASSIAQITKVANAFYKDVENLLLLCISEEYLHSPIKWEAPAPPEAADELPEIEAGELFPHIYGTINPAAVVRVLELPQNSQGKFDLPQEIHNI